MCGLNKIKKHNQRFVIQDLKKGYFLRSFRVIRDCVLSL